MKRITHQEIITRLIGVARAAHALADDTEDNGKTLTIDRQNARDLERALDQLDKLPEPRPGQLVCTGSAKAEALLAQRSCVHCGCTDFQACPSRCHWAVVFNHANAGVCSNCSAPATVHPLVGAKLTLTSSTAHFKQGRRFLVTAVAPDASTFTARRLERGGRVGPPLIWPMTELSTFAVS